MKVSFLDASGARSEVPIGVNMYQAAHTEGLTIDAYLSKQFKTDESRYGSPLCQFMASAGLFAKDDMSLGIRSPKMKAVMDGSCDSMFQAQGSAITADQIPASRILFPAAILQLVENQLYGSRNSEVALFNTFIASQQTIVGARYQWPVLDYTRPSVAQSSRIAQLAEPNLMMTLTASDKTGSVPTYSLGLMISDEAMQQNSLNFVALSMTRQAEIEAGSRLDECIGAMVNGDVDLGIGALTVQHAGTFDASITTSGVITHLAWIKWLAYKRRIRQIDVCLMTINTFFLLENRTGKPIVTTAASAEPFEEVPNIIPSLLNLSLSGVKVMLVESTVIADNLIVGFDSRYAMRKITNSEAEYSAAEQMVLRKANAMRWDWGYQIHRLYDQAWDVLSFVPA